MFINLIFRVEFQNFIIKIWCLKQIFFNELLIFLGIYLFIFVKCIFYSKDEILNMRREVLKIFFHTVKIWNGLLRYNYLFIFLANLILNLYLSLQIFIFKIIHFIKRIWTSLYSDPRIKANTSFAMSLTKKQLPQRNNGPSLPLVLPALLDVSLT